MQLFCSLVPFYVPGNFAISAKAVLVSPLGRLELCRRAHSSFRSEQRRRPPPSIPAPTGAPVSIFQVAGQSQGQRRLHTPSAWGRTAIVKGASGAAPATKSEGTGPGRAPANGGGRTRGSAATGCRNWPAKSPASTGTCHRPASSTFRPCSTRRCRRLVRFRRHHCLDWTRQDRLLWWGRLSLVKLGVSTLETSRLVSPRRR